jgi:molybdopterin/thiamine biosynthesis adenylyltransferase
MRHQAIVRMAAGERDDLLNIILKRYPHEEWGTFIQLGFKVTEDGLVLTLHSIQEPTEGDLDDDTWITKINSQYIRRIIRNCENHPFSLGFVHSHPEEYGTVPSTLDDDMETYISELLQEYTPERPFVSLIFSKAGEKISASGRVYYKGDVFNVTRFAIEGIKTTQYGFEEKSLLSEDSINKVKRLVSLFSIDSAEKLKRAKVGIVGLSGTGSPVAEILARAGIGSMVLVDPDVFTDSNLERIHGSRNDDIGTEIPKVLLAKRHIHSINPDCEVTAIKGFIPQNEIIERLFWCDIVIGCTDQQSSRVALTELSYRYLVPVIDVGVSMEGNDGRITGQVIQINRLFSDDPCVYCRNLIDSQIVAQELMTEEELNSRKDQASKEGKNNNANAYWKESPQLNTVGYLTTTAGGILSGFIIGYLTQRFDMASNRIEISITRKGISVTQQNAQHKEDCFCKKYKGTADQEAWSVLVSPAPHWISPLSFRE